MIHLLNVVLSGFIIWLLISGRIVPAHIRTRMERPPFWDEAMIEVNKIDPLAPLPEIIDVPDFEAEELPPSEWIYEIGRELPVVTQRDHVVGTHREVRWPTT